MRAASLAALLGSAVLLQGCVAAAAIPAGIAAGAIARKGVAGNGDRDAYQPTSDAKLAGKQGTGNQALIVPTEAPVAPPATPAPPPPPSVPPAGMQYLYGSGEAAALSVQAYQSLYNYLNTRAFDRRSGNEVAAVVMAQGATLASPRFTVCGKKQLAAVFDIDETVVLNLGYEQDEAKRGTGYDADRWGRWEATGGDKVVAVPGAIETISAARRLGIKIIFNTNRSAANAAQTAAMLDRLGLGPAVRGDTLWLMGDAGTAGSGKDARRWAIAEKYCVIALVGDQLGDFTDLFNASNLPPNVRRNIATETMVAPLWGSGWFLLPNPVYGSGLKGGFGEVFPADKGWTDPGAAK